MDPQKSPDCFCLRAPMEAGHGRLEISTMHWSCRSPGRAFSKVLWGISAGCRRMRFMKEFHMDSVDFHQVAGELVGLMKDQQLMWDASTSWESASEHLVVPKIRGPF